VAREDEQERRVLAEDGGSMKLILGDSLERLKDLPTSTIDAVVTDPPYGLSFMGKKWDYDVPTAELWREVFRVMKPGAHLLSFFGTRTYHVGVSRIEDAGFEIRDQLCWLYGSGFPKSLDVSKAIDKAAGAEREVIARTGQRCGVFAHSGTGAQQNIDDYEAVITAPATDDAKQWQGWGTALKPANEPIVLARKPLEKGLTVAQNVLKWGTGALNVDAGRIAGKKPQTVQGGRSIKGNAFNGNSNAEARRSLSDNTQGRWPANVLFDEEAAAVLDEQSGTLKSGNMTGSIVRADNRIYGKAGSTLGRKQMVRDGDSGGASRFFYVAKTSKRERNAGLEGMPEKPMNTYNFSEDGSFTKNATAKSGEAMRESRMNHHPTVKPIRLMEYLIKLITPPGGIVLDPFLGSGSTLCAAAKLGLSGIGIEREQEYMEIAKRRIAYWSEQEPEPSDDNDQTTFDLSGA
jgi:DNA modification methylase